MVQISTGTSFWSTLLPPRLLRLLRTQMGTNLTNSTRSESISSLTLTSTFVGFNNKYRNSNNKYGERNYVYFSPQVHEHQWWVGNTREAAFQRFCKYLFLTFCTVFFFSSKHWTGQLHCVCLLREICATGLRMQTVVTNTVWSMRPERGQQFLTMTPRTRSQLKKEL